MILLRERKPKLLFKSDTVTRLGSCLELSNVHDTRGAAGALRSDAPTQCVLSSLRHETGF